MDSVDNFCKRIEALEQPMKVMGAHHRIVERWLRWWRIPWSVVAGVALGLILAGTPPAHAKTFHCGAEDVQCLIDAVNEANANGNKNTIRLAAGTYLLTTINNTTDGSNGLPVVTSALSILGAGAETTIIARDASAPAFCILNVAATGTLTLKRLTIRGGRPCGIFNHGRLMLIENIVADNGAIGEEGGVVNMGTLLIRRSAIIENAGDGGGGVSNIRGTVTILQSTIARNTAFHGGGGIYNSAGALTVVNSAIVDNDGGDGTGGGIANFSGGVTIRNSTLAGNRIGGFTCSGGAISSAVAILEKPGIVSLTNSTIAENTAFCFSAKGGGIAVFNDGTVTMQNTLLAHNTAEQLEGLGRGPDCSGRVTTVDNNLIGDPTGCTITLQPSDLTGDPGLNTFTDDGTPGSGHFPLRATSQAIDAGNDAVCPRRDQRGQRRVNIRGVGTSICDIGAIEFPGKDDRQHDEEDDQHDKDTAVPAQASE